MTEPLRMCNFYCNFATLIVLGIYTDEHLLDSKRFYQDRWLVNESAVFLLYLPTVYLFLSRLFALTKQLRPALYLPVAATTSNRVRLLNLPAKLQYFSHICKFLML